MYQPRVILCQDSLITAPTVEPLDLEEVKKQRRFSPTTLDTLFDLWISAARGHFEAETGIQLLTATWAYWLEGFPWQRRIELPHPPLQQVLSVTYDDGNGDAQTLDPDQYTVISPSGPYPRRGYVEMNQNLCWPIASCQSASVRIEYRAGFGDTPGAVPELFKYALMMLVGHFHKFGEEISEARANVLQLPLGADAVIKTAKFHALPTQPPLTHAYVPFGYGYLASSWPI